MGFWSWVSSILTVILVLMVVFGAYFFVFNSAGEAREFIVISHLKSPVQGAEITVYDINANGTKGELIAGPVLSDEYGYAVMNLTKPASLRILVESKGGKYSDPLKNGFVNLPSDRVLLAEIPVNNTYAVVTPFTTMAARYALRLMENGVEQDLAGFSANNAVGSQYSIESIITTNPVAAYDSENVKGASTERREYGILLAGFAQEAEGLDVSLMGLSDALSQDWSDGVLDGTDNSKPISMQANDGNTIRLSASIGTSDLQKGINKFMQSGHDVTNLPVFSIATTPFRNNPSFFITSVVLPAWVNGQFGSTTLEVAGGTPPYFWKLKKGSAMPFGFTLSTDGIIVGTGKLSSTSVESISPPFSVIVTDSSDPPNKAEAELRIKVVSQPPDFTPIMLSCQVGTSCEESITSTASGGVPPYYFVSYSSDVGEYPLDFILWSAGTLAGTPRTSGTYALNVCIVDLVGNQKCHDVSISVAEKPSTETKPPVDNGGGCMTGHYKTACGCCLNDWVCCGGNCNPPAFC
ncbi:TPA: hypothetical protein HA238_03640 [Candidatus Micrarchaeota archaeon]|nr:hypothetical protein [Candidatus Micrarchaeota archaeon]